MNYTVDAINQAVKKDIKQFIKQVEQEYHRQLQQLAMRLLADKSKKILLLAGPSGSGKTTSAHILQDMLKAQGVNAHIISLDNFYLPAHRLPKLPDGSPDFESVYSLDVEDIHTCFYDLLTKGRCDIPFFDFMAGARANHTIPIELKADDIAIVEGLHALNPILSDNLPQEKLFKLYVSLSARVVDAQGAMVLTNRQMRFVRRLCRDYVFRNSSAENTLKMWPGVIHGEEKYLYPFKSIADCRFETFHPYEPGVFAKTAIDLLAGVPQEHPQREFIDTVVKGLGSFLPVDSDNIPKNSLIREFAGGGLYS